jgi:hypothetical protein
MFVASNSFVCEIVSEELTELNPKKTSPLAGARGEVLIFNNQGFSNKPKPFMATALI